MHEQDFKNIRDGFTNTPAQCSVIIQVLRITRKLMGDTHHPIIVELHDVPVY